jgi:AraC family transcriptional regulator
MSEAQGDIHLLEADVATRLGRVQVVRRSWDETIERTSVPADHWLELSTLPRSSEARGCFPDHWGPHRFEPIGELFLFPAGERVMARSECRRQSSIICAFAPDAVRDWFEDAQPWTSGQLQGSLDISNSTIRNLVFRLGEEVRSPGFASDSLIELMSAQVAIELARHCIGLDGDLAVGGLAPWRMRRIDERLADMCEAPTLVELGELCNLSVRHLTRAFRTTRGCSIGDYIAQQRVEQSKQLLADGGRIKMIAHAMGFTSPSNFAAAFRRATGETPRQYRQRAGSRLPTGRPH